MYLIVYQKFHSYVIIERNYFVEGVFLWINLLITKQF